MKEKKMNAVPSYVHTLHVGPFRQDIATVYTDIDGLRAENVCILVRAADGAVFAGFSEGLARFDAQAARWRRVEGSPGSAPICWLQPAPDGGLVIGTLQEVCHFPSGQPLFLPALSAAEILAFRQASGPDQGPFLLTARRFFDVGASIEVTLPSGATGRALALLADGTPTIATDRGLLRYADGILHPISPVSEDGNIPGRLLAPDIRDLAADPHGGLWVATAGGLNYYTQGCWLDVTGKEGLPFLDLQRLSLGADGTLWVGSAQGAARLSEGCWRAYSGRRWLPDDEVLALTEDGEGGAWIATKAGLAHIAFVPMTFPAKAAHYEQITADRHNRDGYAADCRLERPGDLNSFLYEATDNDGLWTALYVCAESFRYAVTQEPEARALAGKSMKALLALVHVTGIPGFPARALLHEGERVLQSDPGPNWYPSTVMPGVLYKNDTSSDEIDGHYLAWYVYSALVADADEKRAISETCRAVTNHILDNDYRLVGPTGKRTTWGYWPPDALNRDLQWAGETGLNSLEILSHLKVAIHLCGDTRFVEAYRDLASRCHYALNTVRQKVLPPEGENNHSDDELAACAYYPLLRLETDPFLRGLYLMSLERTQAILRPEKSPFYNVIYGACTGRPCGAEAAAQWLRDAPWDLRKWGTVNSRRADVVLDSQKGRFSEAQLTRVLPPSERRVDKWNANPYAADAPGDGGSEEDGAFWLLPYWMGRYHGIFALTPSDDPISGC
ncbi:MAG TPA: hypothetical protein VFA07_06650 [Chthonomonadaceae bacterium]|nr:hypothetical protein [Chthonomonadaceae bacterium]